MNDFEKITKENDFWLLLNNSSVGPLTKEEELKSPQVMLWREKGLELYIQRFPNGPHRWQAEAYLLLCMQNQPTFGLPEIDHEELTHRYELAVGLPGEPPDAKLYFSFFVVRRNIEQAKNINAKSSLKSLETQIDDFQKTFEYKTDDDFSSTIPCSILLKLAEIDLCLELGDTDRAQSIINEIEELKLPNLDNSLKSAKAKVRLASDSHNSEAPFKYEHLDTELHDAIAHGHAVGTWSKIPIDLKLKTIDGGQFDMGEERGKVLVVIFWAMWCGPCVQELPEVKEIYKKYHDKGLDMVGVSLDANENTLKRFVTTYSIAWPQICDGCSGNILEKQFGVSSIPNIWIFSKKGLIVTCQAPENFEQVVQKELLK